MDWYHHPWPNFNCGLTKPSSKLIYAWLIVYYRKVKNVIIYPCHYSTKIIRDPRAVCWCFSTGKHVLIEDSSPLAAARFRGHRFEQQHLVTANAVFLCKQTATIILAHDAEIIQQASLQSWCGGYYANFIRHFLRFPELWKQRSLIKSYRFIFGGLDLLIISQTISSCLCWDFFMNM